MKTIIGVFNFLLIYIVIVILAMLTFKFLDYDPVENNYFIWILVGALIPAIILKKIISSILYLALLAILMLIGYSILT